MSASKRIAFVLIQQWREQAASLWPRPTTALSLLLWTGKIESVWHDQNLSSPIPHTQSSGLVRWVRRDELFWYEPREQKNGGGGCFGRAVTFPMMSAFPITDLTRDSGRWFNGGILFLLTSPENPSGRAAECGKSGHSGQAAKIYYATASTVSFIQASSLQCIWALLVFGIEPLPLFVHLLDDLRSTEVPS